MAGRVLLILPLIFSWSACADVFSTIQGLISKPDTANCTIEVLGNITGFSFPGGESIKSFENRIEKVLDSIYKCESPVAVLVCHAGVIRYLICNLLGIEYNRSLSFNIEPGSLTHMKLFDNRMGILSAVNVKGIFSWPA